MCVDGCARILDHVAEQGRPPAMACVEGRAAFTNTGGEADLVEGEHQVVMVASSVLMLGEVAPDTRLAVSGTESRRVLN